MVDIMTDMKRVTIIQDEDGEAAWLDLYDDPEGWTTEIPATDWAAWENATREIHRVLETAIAASGRTRDGHSEQPCDSYTGQYLEPRCWWIVKLTASDDHMWPIRDAELSTHQSTEAEAQEVLDAIAAIGSAYIINSYSTPTSIVKVDPARLSVEQRGWKGIWPACDECGRGRDEHETTKEPNE